MKSEKEIREAYEEMLKKGEKLGTTEYGKGWRDAIEFVLGIEK